MIVGAPGYPAGANHGRVYLYFGQAGASLPAAPVLDGHAGDAASTSFDCG